MKYTETENQDEVKFIVRENDDLTISWIPVDPANSDYQAYLNKDKPQVEHLTEIVPSAD